MTHREDEIFHYVLIKLAAFGNRLFIRIVPLSFFTLILLAIGPPHWSESFSPVLAVAVLASLWAIADMWREP